MVCTALSHGAKTRSVVGDNRINMVIPMEARAKTTSNDSPRACAPEMTAEIQGCPTCCVHCLAGEPSVWDDALFHYAHPAGTGSKLKTCYDPWRERCRRCSGSPGACRAVR
jgi:hypothetical protein